MIEIKNRFTGNILLKVDAADLRGADLRSADLRGAEGNGREVVSFNLEFKGVITSEWTWIGCRKHPTKTWWDESEKEAASFTTDQIAWREKNGAWVRAMIKSFLTERK